MLKTSTRRSLLATAVLGLAFAAPLAHADGSIGGAMRSFKKDFGAAMSSKTMVDFNKAIDTLQADAQKAATLQAKKPEIYQDGIKSLLQSIDEVKKVAAGGNLDEAKKAMSKIGAVRDEYHAKIGL